MFNLECCAALFTTFKILSLSGYLFLSNKRQWEHSIILYFILFIAAIMGHTSSLKMLFIRTFQMIKLVMINTSNNQLR